MTLDEYNRLTQNSGTGGLAQSAVGPTVSNAAQQFGTVGLNQPQSTQVPVDSSYLGQTPEYWQEFGASGGVSGDSSVAGQALGNQGQGFDLGNQNWGMDGLGGTMVGAGQLGLGLASYFENKKTAGMQRDLMGQQIANNKTEMDAKQGYRDALGKFGK